MNGYAYIDIAFTVLAVILAFRGFTRGFIKEFFALGAPIFGVIAGFIFYKPGGAFIRENYITDMAGFPEILAFILIFILFFMICKLVQKVLQDVIMGLKLGSLDKLLGGILGTIEGIAAIALILFLITSLPMSAGTEILENSLYGKIILPLLPPYIINPIMEGRETFTNSAMIHNIHSGLPVFRG